MEPKNKLVCPSCGNHTTFDLEEMNWVKYRYKNGELTNRRPEVTETCERSDSDTAWCSKCGAEVDIEKFRKWAWGD